MPLKSRTLASDLARAKFFETPQRREDFYVAGK